MRPYHNKDRSGFQIIYNEGDPCLADPLRNYQSHVKYQCDPDGHSNMFDFPQLVTAQDDFDANKQCIFDFVWNSRFACSPCTREQVTLHKGMCDENGVAQVSVQRNPGEFCVLDFPPESYLKYHPDY